MRKDGLCYLKLKYEMKKETKYIKILHILVVSACTVHRQNGQHKHNNTRVQGQLIAAHYYPPPVDADEDYDGVFSPALWFV